MPPAENLFRFVIIAIALGLVAPLRSATNNPWPHERSDIAPDPAIHWGRLDNGLRYVLRKNNQPADRVCLILQVDVGSLQELDHQKGYAHFIEHLMFRGTKKFPANTLFNLLQNEGLALGADTNAFTNQRSTYYVLDLPKNSPDKIALGLSILRDFADGALLDQADVTIEAKVIESERRVRESSYSGVAESLSGFTHPNSRFTTRSPIGTTESVLQATSVRLREFYRTWYRPALMTVIAVGDFDPKVLEQLTREQFSSQAPATPTEPLKLALSSDEPPADGVRTGFFKAPFPGNTTCFLSCVALQPPGRDSIQSRRGRLLQQAANDLFHARLTSDENWFGTAESNLQIESGYRRSVSVVVASPGSLWPLCLQFAVQNLRGCLHNGFSATEVLRYVKAERAKCDQGLSAAISRNSKEIAESIREDLESGRVTAAPETEMSIADPFLKNLTADACSQALRELWAPANRSIAIVSQQTGEPTPKEILTAFENSLKDDTFLYRSTSATEPNSRRRTAGPAGGIAQRIHNARLDTESVTFVNGIRLNIKRTDFEKGLIQFQLRLGRGRMAEPPDQPGLGVCAIEIARNHSQQTADRLDTLADLSIDFSAAEDAFTYSATGTTKRLNDLLQKIARYLVPPTLDHEGFPNTAWPDHLRHSVAMNNARRTQLERDPVNYLRAFCPPLVLAGDIRYGLPATDTNSKIDPDKVFDWTQHCIADGRIEIGLAGDVDVNGAIDAVARTLGNLPKRSGIVPSSPETRPVLAKYPLRQTWDLTGGVPDKAAVQIYWSGVDADDIRTSRQLQVLAQILENRIFDNIREKLGATYSPRSGVWGSNAWSGVGYFYVEIETSPRTVDRVAVLVGQIAAEIAKHGIKDDEFTRAIKPTIASLPQLVRSNSFWTANVLSQLQEKPKRADWPLTLESDYRDLRREDIEAVARKFLAGQGHIFIAKTK